MTTSRTPTSRPPADEDPSARATQPGDRVYRHVPQVTCRGTDRLSGIASCTVRTRVHGDHVTYRVVATDRAGNRTVKKGRFDYRA